jgi:hypothetical protein
MSWLWENFVRTVGLGVVACVLGTLDCKHSATEIVLRVDTDMDQGPTRTLTAVRVRVWQSSSERAATRQFLLLDDADRSRLPAEIGLVPGEREDLPVHVEVTAFQGTTELFTQHAVALYEPGRVGLLEVVLSGHCIQDHVRCGLTETCASWRMCERAGNCSTASACEPVNVQRSLPSYTGRDVPRPTERSLRRAAGPRPGQTLGRRPI